MPGAPQTQLEQIRERVASGDYQVDAREVADALLDRLIAGRSVREVVGRSR